MDGWRKQRGEFHRQDFQAIRSRPRKPITGRWQPKLQSVPSWEKKFCFLVGSVPWRKLLETKKYIYLYDNVVQWNDSAGEEAFHNAKTRFWAEINGLPCDISSPDPDACIDEIDWDSKIDQELLLDLDRETVPVEGSNDENGVIIGNPLLLNPAFSCVGWGEAEDDFEMAQNNGTSKDNNDETVKNKTGLTMSRHANTRYYGENWQMGHGGRGRREGGKRVHFNFEEPFMDKWNSSYCRPISYDVSNKGGDQWGWEKSIL